MTDKLEKVFTKIEKAAAKLGKETDGVKETIESWEARLTEARADVTAWIEIGEERATIEREHIEEEEPAVRITELGFQKIGGPQRRFVVRRRLYANPVYDGFRRVDNGEICEDREIELIRADAETMFWGFHNLPELIAQVLDTLETRTKAIAETRIRLAV